MLWLLALPLLSLAAEPLIVQGDVNGATWSNIVSNSQIASEDVLIRMLEQWDVVEVMKLTGHGEGLDEERTIQVFGEDETRV